MVRVMLSMTKTSHADSQVDQKPTWRYVNEISTNFLLTQM